MRRSGTSRAPLREALRLLGQRGLVEHLPRRGVRVARLSAREVSELFGLRDVLERFAVDLALGPGLPPDPLRLGVADRRHGAAQIAAWRRAHPGVPPGRRLSETVIVAVDERTAVVSTLSGYPDSTVEGRRAQTWVRFADGWRVVAAHVSEVPAHESSSSMSAAT